MAIQLAWQRRLPGDGRIEERRLRARLRLEHAGLVSVEVGVEVHGPVDGPAVVVLGGISAHRHLCPTPTDPGEGWWPGMVGPGLPVDTDRYRAIGIDFAGAPGTTCPCGRITTVDQARLVMAALDDLGVDRSTIVGSSYGGMVALAAAGRWPERITGLVIACAAHRPHPMATALRGLQREIVERGRARGDAKWGLIIARALAMTTYRSADEFEARFGSSATWGSGRPTFPVEEYLRARGEAFSARFDPESFLRLSESIDCHDVDPRAIRAQTTLISVDTDAVVPEFLADELDRLAPGVTSHVKLTSPFGHDAFLKEIEAVGRAVGTALAATESVR